MTSRYMNSQYYTVETGWQATPLDRKHVRRMADARDDPGAPQFDTIALTNALSLNAKPVATDVARKVAGTYAIPYDSLMARRRRANSAA